MLGGRHLPTAIQLINQENELFKHHKKLEEIHKAQDKRKKQSDKQITEKTKLFETRERGLKFHHSEKQFAIEKDNELLLGRLVEISRKKKPNLFPLKSEATISKSLHGPSRRKEKDRIAMENEAFARRLLSQQPSFNRRKLDSDFEKHQTRVKNMQKLVVYSPRKIKLPPLRTTEFEKPKSGGKQQRAEKEKRPTNKKEEKIVEVDEAKEVDDRKHSVIQETEPTRKPETPQPEIQEHEIKESEIKEPETKQPEDNLGPGELAEENLVQEKPIVDDNVEDKVRTPVQGNSQNAIPSQQIINENIESPNSEANL